MLLPKVREPTLEAGVSGRVVTVSVALVDFVVGSAMSAMSLRREGAIGSYTELGSRLLSASLGRVTCSCAANAVRDLDLAAVNAVFFRQGDKQSKRENKGQREIGNGANTEGSIPWKGEDRLVIYVSTGAAPTISVRYGHHLCRAGRDRRTQGPHAR